MRISDWSSDVCSSDLGDPAGPRHGVERTDDPAAGQITYRTQVVRIGSLAMSSADLDAVNLALLVLRCGIGAVMLAHGINNIFGGGKIEGTGRWFESLGMKPGLLHAWLASVTEIVGGALLILGLLTTLGRSEEHTP